MNKLYSSFAQTKGLLWRKHFDGILKGNLLPPIGAVIDLTDRCQLSCTYCQAKAFRSNNTLDTEHVKRVIDDLASWRLKSYTLNPSSICFAGGGEPTLHPAFAEIIQYASKRHFRVGISTNGVDMQKDLQKTIAQHATFCGFSIDAGSAKTYLKTKKLDSFKLVLKNASSLNKLAKDYKSPIDTTYKFLITPENQHEISAACILAKQYGFHNFFARPAALENIPGLETHPLNFSPKLIMRQLKRCLSLETSNFYVYSSFNRVNKKLLRNMPFKRCLATPLFAIYCADGFAYLCMDYRERSCGRLCKHLNLREFWNSPEHHMILDSIDLEKCPRCTMGNYNEQIACYRDDTFFRDFP